MCHSAWQPDSNEGAGAPGLSGEGEKGTEGELMGGVWEGVSRFWGPWGAGQMDGDMGRGRRSGLWAAAGRGGPEFRL